MQQIYNESFKIQLVNSYESGTKVKSLCDDYNIPQSTMYHWINQYRKIQLNETKHITAKELLILKSKMKSIETENAILKESGCTPQSPLNVKLESISKLDGKYSIHSLCRTLEILRSTYYHYKLRRPEQTVIEKEDARFKPVIKDIFEHTKGRLGARKIKVIMSEKGYTISARRINRLMNEMNLVCVLKKKYKQYNFAPNMVYRHNSVNRDFNQTDPNKVWVSDITHIYVNYKPYYLCTIIDLYSRKVIAYSISNNQKLPMVKKAFEKAYKERQPNEGLTFHSDQGGQYVSYEFRKLLRNRRIKQSFSNPGCPYDNAVAESFFKSLKAEEVYRHYYPTYDAMKRRVIEYIDFFNDERPHQSLKYLTPNKLEETYFNTK